MIDKIYVLNIKKDKKRRELCLAALREQAFPENKIEIFDAKTPAGLKDREAVCKAAIADGHSLFEKLLALDVTEQVTLGWYAQLWSYLSFLKHIQNTGENAILLHDDVQFYCTWEELNDAITRVMSDDLVLCKLGTHLQGAHRSTRWISPSSMWSYGTSDPSDGAIFWTPAGSQFIESRCSVDANVEFGWHGWMWSVLFVYDNAVKNNENVYELWINPTADNKKNISRIQKDIERQLAKDTRNVLEYSAIGQIQSIVDSNMDYTKTGETIR